MPQDLNVPQRTKMFSEAQEAPQVVADQLHKNSDVINEVCTQLLALAPRAVVTLARGSSDNAATFAKYLIETKLGILTSSAAPSISSIYSARTELKNTLVIAISQSGRSPDLTAALDVAKRAGAFILVLVNAAETPLAQFADVVLPLHAGAERSVAATKSCIASMTAIAQLVATWSGDHVLREELVRLPPKLEQAWRLDWSAGDNEIVRGTGFVCRRPWHRLWRGARGGSETQRNLRLACRGVQFCRSSARPDGACKQRIPRPGVLTERRDKTGHQRHGGRIRGARRRCVAGRI